MLLEICMQIHSVVFALSQQIYKQKYTKAVHLLRADNKVFVTYLTQGGGGLALILSPCLRPWVTVVLNFSLKYEAIASSQPTHALLYQ